MQAETSLTPQQVLFSLQIPVRFFFLKKIDYAIVPCSRNRKKKIALFLSTSSLSINQGGLREVNSSASQFSLRGESA